MRYEELSLPLSGGPFQLRFHSRLTILAGLTPTERADLVDALAAASAGQVKGGTLVYRDSEGRRVVVRDGKATYLDDGTPAPGTVSADAGEVRSLLVLQPDELGLPRALSDDERAALEKSRMEVSASLELAKVDLDLGRTAQEQRRRLMTELEDLEGRLAAAGGQAEREKHEYRSALVGLERVRATIDAVSATPQSVANDEKLLTAAIEAHALADEWSQAVDRLDELLAQFNGRTRLPGARLLALRDVPDHPPADLAALLAAHEKANDRLTLVEAELEQAQSAGSNAPDDVRILALATIDQETLWLAHRRVLLANEQLEQARLAAATHGRLDPEDLARVEAVHDRLREAEQRVERASLPGMLIISLMLCLSLLMSVADLGREVVPALLGVAALTAYLLNIRPRLAARRVARQAREAVAATGAQSLAELRQRYIDDGPDSAAWRRADEIVDEFESAIEAWHDLVGNLSVAEVGEMEDEVQRFVAESDPHHHAQRLERIRHAADRARGERDRAAARLGRVLAPYDLRVDDLPHTIGAAIHDRIRDGVTARLQLALQQAEEAERKVGRRLEGLLSGLGFTDGNLEARVGALGWAIDEARQRQARRSQAAPLPDLEAERHRLEQTVMGDRRSASPPPAARPEPRPEEDPATVQLRERRNVVRAELALLSAPDVHALRLAHDRLALRLAAVDNQLANPGPPLEEDTEERMVATLVNLRPTWFDSNDDPMPAVLDEPFTAVAADRRGRLLNLVLAASETTQIVLLTSDPLIAMWARNQALHSTLSLLEPSGETAGQAAAPSPTPALDR